MPVLIQATGETADEAVRDLVALASRLSGQVSVASDAPQEEVKPRKRKSAPKQDTPAPEATNDVVTEEEEQVTTDSDSDIPSLDAIKDKLREVRQKNGVTNEAIRGLLKKFGAEKASSVPEEQRAAFLAELEQL